MLKSQSFKEDEQGTVAIIFAILFLFMLVMIGAAHDFSRHRSRANLVQNALDYAVLAVSREATDSSTNIQEMGQTFFDSNLTTSSTQINSFQVVRGNGTIRGEVIGHVSTNFLGLIGIETLSVNRIAESEFGPRTREIALVLDVTGSMAGEKLDRLKDASIRLIDRLETASNSTGQNRIALVPFNAFVNVGPSNFDEDWLDIDGRSDVAQEFLGAEINHFDLFDHLGSTWRGCVRARADGMALDDTSINASQPETKFVPNFFYDEQDENTFGGNIKNDYLEDFPGITDELASARDLRKYGISPSDEGNSNAWLPVTLRSGLSADEGPNGECTSPPITPLTDNYSSLRSAVNGLVADGNTNMTEAIVWGQRVLSNKAPFREGRLGTTANNDKILVFLSDGNNSLNDGNGILGSDLTPDGYAAFGRLADELPSNPTDNDLEDRLDSNLSIACENIKNTGTRIFTIRLELDDSNSLDLLRDCASSPRDFLDTPDSADLDDTFDGIVDEILEVRLRR